MKNFILLHVNAVGKSMADKLAAEIIDANEQGGALNVKKICTVWLKLTVHSLTLDSNQSKKLIRKELKMAKMICI